MPRSYLFANCLYACIRRRVNFEGLAALKSISQDSRQSGLPHSGGTDEEVCVRGVGAPYLCLERRYHRARGFPTNLRELFRPVAEMQREGCGVGDGRIR